MGEDGVEDRTRREMEDLYLDNECGCGGGPIIGQAVHAHVVCTGLE